MAISSWVRVIVGVVLLALGALWFLQGIDVIGGSGMSGSTFWAVAGAVVFGVGAIVLLRRGRRA